MNISIIIPNLNGAKLLSKNLPRVLSAVKDYKEGTVEIIIADDPSIDNSGEIITDFISKLKDKNVIGKTISNKNKKEAGFSKNVNRGVGLATGEILILLNSDVVPTDNFLTPLLNHFEDEQVFAVGCMDESEEHGNTVYRGRGLASMRRGLFIHRKGNIDRNDTLWVSGGSGAFRKSIWDRLGGLDTLFNPFYWEDIDISYRAIKSGYKILFESKSVVIHSHHEGIIKNSVDSQYVHKISYRNQFIFIWKNITDTSLILAHILWLPYHLIKALVRGDSAFIRGFIMALNVQKQIRKSKKSAKRMFKLTDKSILKRYA